MPDKQGYIKKVGAINTSVRRRWFQLWESSPPFFSYYQCEGGAHIRTVRIEGADNHVIINPKEPNAFNLISGNRTWNFCAESGAEMSSWVQHFSNACDEARRASFSHKKTENTDRFRVLVAGEHSPCCAAAVQALLKSHLHCQVRAFVRLNDHIARDMSEEATLEMVYIYIYNQLIHHPVITLLILLLV